jgi:hypothetical protein
MCPAEMEYAGTGKPINFRLLLTFVVRGLKFDAAIMFCFKTGKQL